jgi:hypothetical protein
MKLRAISVGILGLALVTTQGATFTVTTTGDSGPGSLRQAMSDANATPGDHIIVFTINGTMVLSSPLPTVTHNTVIAGPGTNHLTISGSNAVQIFSFNTGTTNTISGLTMANAKATGYSNGAAIANAGHLTISNCFLVNNTNLYGWGGAIYNSGHLAILSSTLAANQAIGETGFARTSGTAAGGGAAGMGGGIFSTTGTMFIACCMFTGNSATGGDGGSAAWPISGGTGRGGGIYGGGWCGVSGGFGSGGGGASAGQCPGGGGGFGGGGGGNVGDYGREGAGGLGGGSGGYAPYGCGSGGGGAGMGGAIFIANGLVTITNSSFQANQATGGQERASGMGGGIFANTGLVTIVNCSFAGNQVNAATGGGAAIGPDFFNYASQILPQMTATTPGGGTVGVDPPNSPYLSNSWVTLTASPAPGWQFLCWLGDATGTNQTTTIQVTRSKYAQALFGTPLSRSALMSLKPEASFYPYGTAVKLTALPPTGTYFTWWTGDASGTNTPLTLTVTKPNQSVSYQLGTLSPGEVALATGEEGGGHITVNRLANRYTIGEAVTLTATPDPGQDFLGWTGDASGTQNPTIVTMSQSKLITANFTKRPSLRVGTPLEGLVEDGFRLTLIGEFGTNYALLGSTNLADWSQVETVTNTYGTVQFTDAAATNNPASLYRAASQ